MHTRITPRYSETTCTTTATTDTTSFVCTFNNNKYFNCTCQSCPKRSFQKEDNDNIIINNTGVIVRTAPMDRALGGVAVSVYGVKEVCF